MANETKLVNLINPEVMADMIDGKIANAMVVTPFAKIDTTLKGQPGSKVTVPTYKYIGDAEKVAEGAEMPTAQLTATTKEYEVAKAGKCVTISDEALLSAYGNPKGQIATQLAQSIASKVDNDGIDALLTATRKVDTKGIIAYKTVVTAIDKFEEEVNTPKVMFIHPKQVTQLRLDPDFISADKYDNNVVMKGEIGMICNTRIVPSKKIKVSVSKYNCPIVKLEQDDRTEDETPALTVFLKRDTLVETDRHIKTGMNDVAANKHYVSALTNDAKVVVAQFAENAPA